ncbi:MAG: hypothetical protein OHK0046_34460 [Anaerolineae bacterium]
MKDFLRRFWRWLLIGGMLTACSLTQQNEPQVVYITATPASLPAALPQNALVASPAAAFTPASNPTPNAPRVASANIPQEHVVQPNDTLYGIALAYGVSVDSLLAVNQLDDPNTLFVGQSITLPEAPSEYTPAFKILPDSRLVRAPGSAAFDIAAFVQAQPGYIRVAADDVDTRQADGSTVEERLSAAQIVERVSLEFSVDPRVLLALLEYRAGWLTNPAPAEELLTHPLISKEDAGDRNREGLYRQLSWAADRLNFGYYNWKYNGLSILEFPDEARRLIYDPGINAGTVAVQYFLSQNTGYTFWLAQTAATGFYQTYVAYFGDPFTDALEPLVPANLTQPEMTLPFAQGEVWFYTGGWHGGWGSGSAWAAVDFAPPDEPAGVACYTSAFWVRAVAPGLIVRSDKGVVMLDLDGDGDESTGWTVLYLHIASEDRVAAGTRVNTGDIIGRAACEGGFSTATHLHIGRRYNGEWLPAQCIACSEQYWQSPFTMSGWSVVGIRNQEYQGFLQNNGEQRVAEQGRFTPDNRISW